MLRKVINLFDDKSIKCHKTVFNITSEEDLYEWWEFHLESSLSENTKLINFVHALYRAISRACESINFKSRFQGGFDIIYEYSLNSAYWTIWNEELACEILKHTQSLQHIDSKQDEKKISFHLTLDQNETLLTPLNRSGTPAKKVNSTKKLIVYNFFDGDDFISLQELQEDLNDQLSSLHSTGFNEITINYLLHDLNQYILILQHYTECHIITRALQELSYFMNEHKSIITNLDSTYVSLFEGLIVNIIHWFEALFINGIEKFETFDKSIEADVEIIKTMVAPPLEEDVGELEFF